MQCRMVTSDALWDYELRCHSTTNKARFCSSCVHMTGFWSNSFCTCSKRLCCQLSNTRLLITDTTEQVNLNTSVKWNSKAHRCFGAGHGLQEHMLPNVGPGLCPSLTVLALRGGGESLCVRGQPHICLGHSSGMGIGPAGRVAFDISGHGSIGHSAGKSPGAGLCDGMSLRAAAAATDVGVRISSCTEPPPYQMNLHEYIK